VIHVLIEGLVLRRVVTPELCPEAVPDAEVAALTRR
jgi:hypothetical protein